MAAALLVVTACDTEPDDGGEAPSQDEAAPEDGTDPGGEPPSTDDPDERSSTEADPDAPERRPQLDAEVQTFDGPFFDTSTLSGTIGSTRERAFHGDRSMEITVASSQGFGYSRVQEPVRWDEGDEVVYGAAFYLEPGFNASQADGSVDILRWDNWDEYPDEADHGGLTLLSDGHLALISESNGREPWTILLGPFDMPEGEWVELEVRQRLSSTDGEARNEVWMDGRYLDGNDAANFYGRPITRFRVGIIGTPDPQPGELRMFVDRAAVAREGIVALDDAEH